MQMRNSNYATHLGQTLFMQGAAESIASIVLGATNALFDLYDHIRRARLDRKKAQQRQRLREKSRQQIAKLPEHLRKDICRQD